MKKLLEKDKKVSSFKQISASKDFTWSSTKSIKVLVTGLKTPVPTISTLIVSDVAQTKMFYQGNHLMSEDLKLDLKIPATTSEVLINFGDINKTYIIGSDGVITHDYLPNIEEEPEVE